MKSNWVNLKKVNNLYLSKFDKNNIKYMELIVSIISMI